MNVNHIVLSTSIGSLLSLYKYSLLNKKTKNENESKNVYGCGDQKSSYFERGALISEYTNFTRFLADTPANLMTPHLFTEYVKNEISNLSNVVVEVYDKEYLEKNNMNLFLSVTEGSAVPPKLLIIRYAGNKNSNVDVSLVGKGITFDSGGISLKPSSKMSDMKADMLGGASVVSAILLAARSQLEVNIVVTVPLCENMPGRKATKPGDVKVSMSGTSVEIDNTDAEGRLVLADALTHALLDNPNYIIDVATLTGAVRVALGNIYMGMFSNDDELAKIIIGSGKRSGDEVWRLPYDKRYLEGMQSVVADIKNVGVCGGGSCTGAVFLGEFVSGKWAHVDVAGTMKDAFEGCLWGKGMSGKPVMLLFEVVNEIARMRKDYVMK